MNRAHNHNTAQTLKLWNNIFRDKWRNSERHTPNSFKKSKYFLWKADIRKKYGTYVTNEKQISSEQIIFSRFFYGIQITDKNIPHSSQMKESRNQRQPIFLAVSITKHALAIYCPFLLIHHKKTSQLSSSTQKSCIGDQTVHKHVMTQTAWKSRDAKIKRT